MLQTCTPHTHSQMTPNHHRVQADAATQLTDVATLPNGQSAQAILQDQAQDEWEVDYEDIERGRRIGIGSFGEVFHCTWQMTDVAVKRLLDQDLSDQRMAVRCSLKWDEPSEMVVG